MLSPINELLAKKTKALLPPNFRIITIDKYIFSIENNIENLEKSITVNFDKQNTITKPIYTHLGGYEEVLSFEATILLDDLERFKGFEELVKEGRALKISAFDLIEHKHILIHSLSFRAEHFIKRRFFEAWYYAKELKISGALITSKEDYKCKLMNSSEC
ncbi:MAG: hypothetical protein ACTTH5_04805 [Wolinella sp.]